MALISLAIDYKKTPIKFRSEFALSDLDISMLYKSILSIQNVIHAVILSTCNRTEIYLEVFDIEAIDNLILWWQGYVKITDYKIAEYIKIKQGTEVIVHLMKLACGLESMILGEPQILGQLKKSYTLSKLHYAMGKELDRVFQKVFATAKKVRSYTKIGHCPVSIAFSAINLAKRQLDDISNKNVIIIGAGETGELLFRHVTSLLPKKIMLVNRTIEKAKQIIKTFKKATAHYLVELPDLIKKADIIIAAVNVSEYIITTKNFNNDKPRIFIDISIPQALDPKIGKLNKTFYYSVDDINILINGNKNKRKYESSKAQKIILRSLEEYLDKEKAIISNSAIKELFQKADGLIDRSLKKSLSEIKNGKDSEEILKKFAYKIKKKILHYPVVGIKEASKHDRNDYLIFMKRMFGLNMENK